MNEARTWRAAALVFALAFGLSCSDSGTEPLPVDSDPALEAGLLVSQSAGRAAISASAGAEVSGNVAGALDDELAWVSLHPGAVLDGESAEILNERSGDVAFVGVIDGGFDPVPLAAEDGDYIVVNVRRGGNRRSSSRRESRKAPPTVVRTNPTRGRVDVPVNTNLFLIFSEPIDAATVTADAITLQRSGVPVPGATGLIPGREFELEFIPDQPLLPGTTYTVTVSSSIKDLEGESLGDGLEFVFSTGIEVSESNRWIAGGWMGELLPNPDGYQLFGAYDIADNGAIVGSAGSNPFNSLILGFHLSGSAPATVLTGGFYGSAEVTALNESGLLVGWIEHDAVAWRPPGIGTATVLPSLQPGAPSRALAVNESNLIAGYSTDQIGQRHAVMWVPDGSSWRLVDLGTLSGTHAEALTINEVGTVGGFWQTGPDAGQQPRGAFLAGSGVVYYINSLDGDFPRVNGINSAAAFVGSARSPSEAFLMTGVTATPMFLGAGTEALDISDRGRIVGARRPGDPAFPEPATWHQGVEARLPFPGHGFARAVNSCGVAVGTVFDVITLAPGQYVNRNFRAIRWTRGTLVGNNWIPICD
jgi:uncharacterized membrane protein